MRKTISTEDGSLVVDMEMETAISKPVTITISTDYEQLGMKLSKKESLKLVQILQKYLDY